MPFTSARLSLPLLEFKHLLEMRWKNVSWPAEKKEWPMYLWRWQTHQTRSLPRPLHSHSPSPHHISMTTTHTCWWIPHSRISLGGTSVCLRARDERDREITAEVLWSYKGSNKKHLQDALGLDFYRPHNAVKTHPIPHHSGQLILLSGLPLQRHAERSWNTANAQSAVKQKNNSPPTPPPPTPLFFLPICSSWHRIGLIQITLRFIWSVLLIIHVCLQCSLKQPGMKSKGQPTRQNLYLFFWWLYSFRLYLGTMVPHLSSCHPHSPVRWAQAPLHQHHLSSYTRVHLNFKWILNWTLWMLQKISSYNCVSAIYLLLYII